MGCRLAENDTLKCPDGVHHLDVAEGWHSALCRAGGWNPNGGEHEAAIRGGLAVLAKRIQVGFDDLGSFGKELVDRLSLHVTTG